MITHPLCYLILSPMTADRWTKRGANALFDGLNQIANGVEVKPEDWNDTN